MSILIRREQPSDVNATRCVVKNAFGRTDEADLMEHLRFERAVSIGFVADSRSDVTTAESHGVVGYVAFSSVTIGETERESKGLGLAPLAVTPKHQRRGIGGALVDAGLVHCRRQDANLVVVLGDPDYYPRFGFRRAYLLGLTCEYESVSREAFMAVELTPGGHKHCGGVVRYHQAFSEL